MAVGHPMAGASTMAVMLVAEWTPEPPALDTARKARLLFFIINFLAYLAYLAARS